MSNMLQAPVSTTAVPQLSPNGDVPRGTLSTAVPLAVRPSRGKWLWLVAIGLAFGAGWLVAGGNFRAKQKDNLPPETAVSERDPAAVVVTVAPVTYRPLQRTIEGMGTLHGFEEIVLSARVEGRVHKLRFDVADRVKPGEVLLEIDPIHHELSVQQAENALHVELAKLGLSKPPNSEVDIAKVPSVMQAQTRMENAQSRYERLRKLNPTGAVSREELDTATSDFRAAHAEHANQLLQAKSGLAMIQMKQSALAVAKQQLKDTEVRVPTPTIPIPGTSEGVVYSVGQRGVSEGTLVKMGTEVGKLVLTQTLKLRVPVPERFGAEVQVGQKAHVFSAAFRQPFLGTVTRRNPTVDPLMRTFEVEIQIPNPQGELMPGGFAKVDILTRLDDKATMVPLSAVVNYAGINKLFLLENGRAKEVQVTLGEQTSESIEILKPTLPKGAQIITSGQTVLANDTPVVVR